MANMSITSNTNCQNGNFENVNNTYKLCQIPKQCKANQCKVTQSSANQHFWRKISDWVIAGFIVSLFVWVELRSALQKYRFLNTFRACVAERTAFQLSSASSLLDLCMDGTAETNGRCSRNSTSAVKGVWIGIQISCYRQAHSRARDAVMDDEIYR